MMQPRTAAALRRATTRPYAAAALLLAAGCTAEVSVSVQVPSDAIRKSISEVHAFVFAAAPGEAEPPGCERLDPRGLGPGDAEARTGRAALHRADGVLKDPIAELPELPAGRYTLVVEGWGAGCEATVVSARDANETACSRFAQSGPKVLRGYQCVGLELAPGARRDLAVSLAPFAPIGSLMRVPSEKTVAYDDDRPLPLVDGFGAPVPFRVQLLDAAANSLDGVAVRWTVLSGAATFETPQPTRTQASDLLEDGGYASAVLLAGLAASSIDGGRIVVTAYAPGFEGSPISFVARSVRAVELEATTYTLPLERIDLAATDDGFRPALVDDLDGDGRADVVTVGGQRGSGCAGAHQLGVLYGREGGGFEPAYSPMRPGRGRALASAQLDPGGARSLLVGVSACGLTETVVVEGQQRVTPVVQSPGLEVWSSFEIPPADGALGASPRLFEEATCAYAACRGAPTVPVRKAAVTMDARDIDGDGVDEVVMSRCSWLYTPGVGQDQLVPCYGDLVSYSDSEIVLMRARLEDGALRGFEERAVIPEEHGDGGFRGVRLGDVNGDGSLDLAFTTQSEVGVVCGRRNMPGTGYGFDVTPLQRSDATTTFGQAFALSLDQFDGVDGADAVVSGGLRQGGGYAGMKVNPGEGCAFGGGLPGELVGPRTFGRGISLRAADLNQDGLADVVLIHRDARLVETFFSTGSGGLARGPILDLPLTSLGELGLALERGPDGASIAVAAATAPEENAVVVVRIRPAKLGR